MLHLIVSVGTSILTNHVRGWKGEQRVGKKPAMLERIMKALRGKDKNLLVYLEQC